MSQSKLIDRIDGAVAQKAMLAHSFYRKWTCGELEIETLRNYACQYYAFEKGFPRYLSGVHTQIADAGDRRIVLENLIDEERGENNHQELWLRFGEALGVERGKMVDTEPLPTTTALLQRFEDAVADGPATGLAALYAYESQASAVAESKLDGLVRFYGISEGPGVELFEVHRTADIWHSDAERDLLDRLSSDDDKTVAAATGAADGLWGFLDGVEAAYA